MRPHPELIRMTCLHAPLVPFSTYWEKSIKDNYTTSMSCHLVSLTGGYLSQTGGDSSPPDDNKLGCGSKKNLLHCYKTNVYGSLLLHINQPQIFIISVYIFSPPAEAQFCL